ncbi:hypothetical protein H0H93_011139, partial [Arthromyces matolae]
TGVSGMSTPEKPSGTSKFHCPIETSRIPFDLVSLSYIPEGTSTFIPSFCLQRDARNFSPFPNSFLPERWLTPEQQAELEPGIFKDPSATVTNQLAFVPFSFGPSNCVGKNLAWMEMRML